MSIIMISSAFLGFLRYTKPPFLRIHIPSVHLYAKVQVRAGRVARAADISNLLASDYLLPGFDLYCAHVSVYSLQAVVVPYYDAFAKAAVPASTCYGTCLTCENLSSHWEGNVKALMVCRSEAAGGSFLVRSVMRYCRASCPESEDQACRDLCL